MSLWPQIQTNLWAQIRICGSRFKSVGADLNLWDTNRLQSVATDSINLCHIFKSVVTDCNLWPQIRICGHRFESVGTNCNLWPQMVPLNNNYMTVVIRRSRHVTGWTTLLLVRVGYKTSLYECTIYKVCVWEENAINEHTYVSQLPTGDVLVFILKSPSYIRENTAAR